MVNTVKTNVDVPPPALPRICGPLDMLATHKDDKATFKDLFTKRMAVCSMLFRSLEVDINSALDDDSRETACVQEGSLGMYDSTRKRTRS